jgi:pimeloyl-ACP methyl ester carboxylesterase
MTNSPAIGQPVVILGGFLSSDRFYTGLRERLVQLSSESVRVVPLRRYEWVAAATPPSWVYLLDKLDQTVRRAAAVSVTGQVTLVGHSAGGVLARLYLSPESFFGRVYGGLERVKQVITLGSPHHNARRWIHGGMMSRWMDGHVPGAYFAPKVQYATVAGKLVRGDRRGSPRERQVYHFYRQIAGDGNAWGDGLVPLSSQLLDGAQQIVLDGVSHFTGFGGPWYGSPEVIPRWWQACMEQRADQP